MRVAIVGCGLVGQKRAAGLGEHTLVSCFDQDHGRAEALAAKFSTARAVEKLDTVLENGSIDAVIVATTHDSLASVGLRAICAGKHVLIEKPGARTPEELSPLLEAAAAQHVTVKIGFNHRFHPSIRQARHMLVNGEVGELMYIRARYGHGGRPGYEREWRADPAVSGGGELLDQGSHLIDLSRWFGGDVVDVQGDIGTWYWPMPVEDNAFVRLRMQNGSLAWLHASWTEWKNLFSFEVFGRVGKLQIDGLGGSYGTERLTHYRMLPQMGPPEVSVWEFEGEDRSWTDEFEHFASCVRTGEPPCGSLWDGLANLQVIAQLYARST